MWNSGNRRRARAWRLRRVREGAHGVAVWCILHPAAAGVRAGISLVMAVRWVAHVGLSTIRPSSEVTAATAPTLSLVVTTGRPVPTVVVHFAVGRCLRISSEVTASLLVTHGQRILRNRGLLGKALQNIWSVSRSKVREKG